MEKVNFNPVRGTEEQILSMGYHNGFVYFATDTKKIYLDTDTEEKIPMGGNSGIYYGRLTLPEGFADTQVDFTENDIDSAANGTKNIPAVNDLILNIPDGSFYRVVNVELDGLDGVVISGERLTVAGSGGGGGGGQDTSQGEFKVERITKNNITIKYGDKFALEANVLATQPDGEPVSGGRYVLYRDNAKVGEGQIRGTGKISIDISQYVAIDSHAYKLVYYYDIGGTVASYRSLTWTIDATSFELKWEYKENTLNDSTRPLTLEWTCSGNNLEKKAYFYVNDVCINENEPVEFTNSNRQTHTITEPQRHGLNHGAYKFGLQVETVLGDQVLKTQMIEKQMIFKNPEVDTPIISFGLENNTIFDQYTTTNIPVIYYSPDNINATATLELVLGNEIVDTWKNVANLTTYYWSYTPVIEGPAVLKIRFGGDEISRNVDVNPVSLKAQEASDYAFKFKATNFASNSAVKDWNYEGVTATFSEHFDWINGGLKDVNGERAFVIKAGSTMEINYNPFGIWNSEKGKNIKIIFRATKCRDYDATVLRCANSSDTGLVMRAQGAKFKHNVEIDAPYTEDEKIDFELDITPDISGDVKKYVMTWMDGVPSGLTTYSKNNDFSIQGRTIVIGSELCDVEIYLIRVYERHLTDDEHLDNFIMDAPNATEMVDRYNRNDILDSRGELSPTMLAQKNPNCEVHAYDIPKITQTKNDKVTGCIYTKYKGSSNVVLSATNVTTRVQGTSSAAYGLAAFNIDSDFSKSVITDGNAQEVDGYYINDNSIGVKYTTTKVNVASCEQANNALNQEWYNRFQPYPTNVRLKNPKARDTMEFNPGVLFMLDRNKQTNGKYDASTQNADEAKKNNLFSDTVGYVENPYLKLYSICNMGNSKKNTQVFHDQENPLECCIEVSDNQAAQQWMTSDDFTVANIDPEDKKVNPEYFSFRYPDGGKNIDTHVENWINFVKWMAESNPQSMYNKYENIDSQETYNEKFILNNGTRLKTYKFDPANGIIYHEETEYDPSISVYYIKNDNKYGYTDEPFKDGPRTIGDGSGYKFKGWTAEKKQMIANSPLADEYETSPLNDLIITDFDGEYDTDCYEYRMGKMLYECEEHLVMESVIYHYLFIERHTMLDNVAKNTFWSTEDGKRWDLTRDYDNDKIVSL